MSRAKDALNFEALARAVKVLHEKGHIKTPDMHLPGFGWIVAGGELTDVGHKYRTEICHLYESKKLEVEKVNK